MVRGPPPQTTFDIQTHSYTKRGQAFLFKMEQHLKYTKQHRYSLEVFLHQSQSGNRIDWN